MIRIKADTRVRIISCSEFVESAFLVTTILHECNLFFYKDQSLSRLDSLGRFDIAGLAILMSHRIHQARTDSYPYGPSYTIPVRRLILMLSDQAP
jgi:hypothetical protein